MNQEIKTQWVEALRSGEYKQGKAKLKQIDRGEAQHCCLGVLCEIAKTQGIVTDLVTARFDHIDLEFYAFETGDDRREGYLPTAVREWSGLDLLAQERLAGLNDRGESFEEIAGVIERDF